MRVSQYLLSTLKEVPSDTETISHQLMLRAGIIRKLSSGLYTWLPTGLRVLKKIENIVREEMNNCGAIEVLMPIVQPADLWEKSGRLDKYGPELLHFTDRNKRPFILAPTHEEIITDLISKELNSYKQLPLNLFQIHTKFRDEIRPSFGVIRSREFLMKDAYSFHISQESLQETYNKMHDAYSKIFTRIGLNFCIVQADNGPIGGNISHEFYILVQSSENDVDASSDKKFNYLSSINLTQPSTPISACSVATEDMRLIDAPKVKTISDLIEQFNLPVKKIIKTFVVKATPKSEYPFIALLVRGDHKLNKIKTEKLPQIANPLTFATEKEIRAILNMNPNFLGPVNIPIPMIIDHTVARMNNFAAGANIDGKYYFGINWGRDVSMPKIANICNTLIDNVIKDNKHSLIMPKRRIEIGHIFQLGTRYSQKMNVYVQNQTGNNQSLIMGCYGIGLTRVVAGVIEQHHDRYGIIWPDDIAPFQVAILPINMYKSYCVKNIAEKFYTELSVQGIEVLIDDRKEHYGMMCSDIELIGIPHTIVISDRNLDNNNIEYIYRRSNKKQLIKISEVLSFLIKTIKS